MYFIAPVTTIFVQVQASSWMDIMPTTSMDMPKQHEDVFTDMGRFNAARVEFPCGSSSSSNNGDSPTYQPIEQPIQQFNEQAARFVPRFIASLQDLHDNGYPMMGLNKTVKIADTKYTKQSNVWVKDNADMRMCWRCHTFYSSSENGNGTGVCRYHPKGKKYDEEKGLLVRDCCKEPFGQTEGCQENTFHVTNQMSEMEKSKFMETPRPCGNYDPRSHKIYAIDCEMVYTVSGPALARLTVVDWNEKPVLDLLVRPPTRVLDTVPEFSGLTMKDLEGASETLETCRRKLLKLVNKDTILIGHSLDSDLKALRLIHYKVVDTSLIFKSGEYKVGLKKLALDHLGIAIQSNNPDQFGHDSEEDARVSMQLLKYHIFNCC